MNSGSGDNVMVAFQEILIHQKLRRTVFLLLNGASAELPDGRGHGLITQNRPYKNKSGHGKLPAVKVAVCG
jgi:hypothetical protein